MYASVKLLCVFCNPLSTNYLLTISDRCIIVQLLNDTISDTYFFFLEISQLPF